MNAPSLRVLIATTASLQLALAQRQDESLAALRLALTPTVDAAGDPAHARAEGARTHPKMPVPLFPRRPSSRGASRHGAQVGEGVRLSEVQALVVKLWDEAETHLREGADAEAGAAAGRANAVERRGACT